MANAAQSSSAGAEATPLYTSRIFTGWYTNRSPLRDGVTTHAAEKAGYGRQDSILDGRNMEITSRLTLGRRAGTSAWGAANPYQRINRFYSFNTFTLTNEVIRVMVDDATHVYDAFDGSQKNLIFTKSPGADKTYFLGVGNTLYMTNGVDNKQISFNPTTGVWGTTSNWGIDAPTTPPIASQAVRPNPYGGWAANTVYQDMTGEFRMSVNDRNSHMHRVSQIGTTGAAEPSPWNATYHGETVDNTVKWQNMGDQNWQASKAYAVGDLVVGAVPDPNGINYFYVFGAVNAGTSGTGTPGWVAGIGTIIYDNTMQWKNLGIERGWNDIGANVSIVNQTKLVDSNGYIQEVWLPGKSGGSAPLWLKELGAITVDTASTANVSMAWINRGPFSVSATAGLVYGYAFKNSKTGDISNMSPKSTQITLSGGNQVTVQGDGSTDPQVDTIVLYRTAQGGSTFLWLAEFPNPPAGQKWTYVDTTPDSGLNTEIQAQVGGEGTPLPAGATCLAYHLGRIWAAVGNVVWASAGPDAIASTSSGNAGFATSFTCQSKVIRLWPTSIGLIVFTVRDSYLIQGNGISVEFGGTGLFIKVWIENLPLLSYDAFTVFGTTAFLYTGKNMVISLDPGAGIVEVSQPIADVLENLDPATAYLTYHSHNSRDTALYLGNGQDTWYRLNPSIAPESGFAWSLPASPVMGMSALQSVEVTPGVYELLMGPKVDGGKIFKRNTSLRTDDGAAYPAYSDFGVITLASPGQIAGIGWMNLEAWNTQNEPKLSMLMGELKVTANAPLDPVKRTRHDPPNLPESLTLDSTRYSFLRGGSPIWCRHLIFRADFGASASFDELLSFTIYGSLYQEFAA